MKRTDGPCSTRTLLGLAAAVSIGFIIVFALAIALGNEVKRKDSLEQGAMPLCTDNNCLWEASEILNNMNQSVDPCEDFYEFACGNFANINPLPSATSEITQFSLLQQANDNKLLFILNEPINDTSPNSAEAKTKVFYQSCMDTYTVTNRGGKPLVNLIQLLGGWVPLGNFDWSQTFYGMLSSVFTYSAGYPFFTVSVTGDEASGGYIHTPTEYIIAIQYSNTYMDPYDYLTNNTDTQRRIEAYEKYITTIITQMWKETNIQLANATTVLNQAVDDIVYIETQLANFTVSAPHEPLTQNRMTISDLDLTYGGEIFWYSLLVHLYPSAELNSRNNVYVDQKGYLAGLAKLIPTLTMQQANTYMMWTLVNSYVFDLGWNYVHALQEFLMVIDNNYLVADADYEQGCFDQTTESFGKELSHLFISEQFGTTAYQQMVAIKKLMATTMQQRVPGYSWMDASTQANATAKLQNTADLIGYPTYLLDTNYLNNYFSTVLINDGYHFENMVNLHQFDLYQQAQQVLATINIQTWQMSDIFDANYYYEAEYNQVYFPAGILQHPFFQPAIPQYVNFGSMGRLIGQSLVQVIDPQGAHADQKGNSFDWWSAQTQANFQPINACHENLYKNVSVDGQILPGAMFAAADWETVAAINVAYTVMTTNPEICHGHYPVAYKQYVATYGAENLLPGLHTYTTDQVFFISFAQTYCFNRGDLTNLFFTIFTSDSVPERILLSHVLPQVPQFAAAFQCAKGTPMNNGNVCPGF